MLHIWDALDAHRRKTENTAIMDLFRAEPNRFSDFSLDLGRLLFDYSKTSIDQESRRLLLELAKASGVETFRDQMFAGARINLTEHRAVLHTALRNKTNKPVYIDSLDVMPEVNSTLEKMRVFTDNVRSGQITGATGKRFTDVVNIGIGGSDLGPCMATLALAPYHDGPRIHFVSNVDSAHISDTLKNLNPEQTLIVIASKTFTTVETMKNAEAALRWINNGISNDVGKHFAALSSAIARTRQFGIEDDRVFGFEDWVGGRYSIWGPIGLTVMLAIGFTCFDELLEGANEMDQHFLTEPLENNMPVLLALVGIWHSNVCGYSSRAILPYDQRLSRFPAYLQQLDMESNGKSVAVDGTQLQRSSGPLVWGEPGTNGQHAFYQLIHQGTQVVPCEFMVGANNHEPHLPEHHDLLLANCLAQSEALMCGRSLEQAIQLLQAEGCTENLEQLATHRVFPGNRPSTTLIYEQLTPRLLGQLIALFEHRVLVEGCIWGINSFDQWGVELGKQLATALLPVIQTGAGIESKDGSTRGLLRKVAALRK